MTMVNNPSLVATMMLFSNKTLRGFLGEDLLEQYVTEWESISDPSFGQLTKKRLAEMIIRLNGLGIFKDSNFRLELLKHMKPECIEDIYSYLPSSKKKETASIAEKAQTIATSSWSDNTANRELLCCFGIGPDVFQKETVDTSVMMDHMSSGRFYELLDYQYVVKQKVLNILKQPYELKRVLVHMPTGTGKTKTCMHVIVHYYNFVMKRQGLIIWLAHTTELLQQAYETFSNVWEHLGNGSITTYRLWGQRDFNKNINELDGVMICGIQKLQAIRQHQPELFSVIKNSVRLIVFDEAHKAAAKETRALIESLMVKEPDMKDRSLVGLTATPGRTTLSSDENKLLSNMFEGRLVGIEIDTINKMNMTQLEYLNHEKESNVIRYFQTAKILACINREQLTYVDTFTAEELKKIKASMTNHGYVDFNKTSLELIGKNRSRNTAIMDKLRLLSTEQKPTIVFACSVAHAKLLSLMLTLENIPNAMVLGEMGDSDREKAIADFKDRDKDINILINYEVLTTGFDSTNIQCVFITRPTQSIVLYSQMLGRGLRGPMMGGNEECLLVDVKDNFGKYEPDMAFSHFDSYWS